MVAIYEQLGQSVLPIFMFFTIFPQMIWYLIIGDASHRMKSQTNNTFSALFVKHEVTVQSSRLFTCQVLYLRRKSIVVLLHITLGLRQKHFTVSCMLASLSEDLPPGGRGGRNGRYCTSRHMLYEQPCSIKNGVTLCLGINWHNYFNI